MSTTTIQRLIRHYVRHTKMLYVNGFYFESFCREHLNFGKWHTLFIRQSFNFEHKKEILQNICKFAKKKYKHRHQNHMCYEKSEASLDKILQSQINRQYVLRS